MFSVLFQLNCEEKKRHRGELSNHMHLIILSKEDSIMT